MISTYRFRLVLAVLAATTLLTLTLHAHQAIRPAELGVAEEQHKSGSAIEGVPVILRPQTNAEFHNGRLMVRVEQLGRAAFENKVIEADERDFKPGEQELPIKLNIRAQGSYKVTFTLEGMANEESGFSSKIIRYIDVDRNSRYRIRDAQERFDDEQGRRQQQFERALARNPEDPDLRLLSPDTFKVPDDIAKKVQPSSPESYINARPSGLTQLETRYLQLNADKSWAPEDPITVRGRMVFTDWDGVVKPLINATINVYDDDTFGDEHLHSMVTNWNGEWSVSLNNDDGWLQNGRDIYYKVRTSNSRFQVKNCGLFGTVYDWKSATHDDLSEGTILDFGTETVTSNADSTIVFNMLNDGWNHSVTVGGRDPGFVKTCFPENATNWSRFWENINFEDDFIDGPNVLHHEYAHAIFWFGQNKQNASPGGSHSFADVNQDTGLAWSEGWANAFQHSVRPDGIYHWNEGSPGESLERYRLNNANRDGNQNEGRVAAALIDMMDGANDDNGGNAGRGRDEYGDDNNANRISLKTILNDSIWGNYHADFDSFWSTLAGNLTAGERTDAQQIMYYNWMNVPEPSSCVATKVAAELASEPEAFLDGLRNFRDYGLGEFGGGRRLIQMYYSNSPEMALRLLFEPELRQEAFEIARIFADIGDTLVSNDRLKKIAATNQPVIDKELGERMRSLMEALGKEASPELQSAMRMATEVIDSIEGLDYSTLRDRIAQIEADRPERAKVTLRQWDLTPASQKAAKTPELRAILKPIEVPEDLK